MISVNVLREVFRNLVAWESLYESEGIDVITCEGESWCLWDVQLLYKASQTLLPARQREAIQLFLIDNMREKDAAVKMGVSETNPIAMYATTGLKRLIELAESGKIAGFRMDLQEAI